MEEPFCVAVQLLIYKTPRPTDYSTINNWFSLASRCTNKKCQIWYKTQKIMNECFSV